MNRFHGDLLMGGVRIRELDGEIADDPSDELQWSGEFHIEDEQESLFELHRPYLLILDDGRSLRVEVTDIDHDSMMVHFRRIIKRPK